MFLSTYLQNHFVDKFTFASLAGISIERLDQHIRLADRYLVHVASPTAAPAPSCNPPQNTHTAPAAKAAATSPPRSRPAEAAAPPRMTA